MKHLHLLFLTPVLLSLVSACSGKGWTQEDHGCYSLVSQREDLPRDMVCYKDAAGNRYDFAFGMNWEGVIHNKRTAKYK